MNSFAKPCQSIDGSCSQAQSGVFQIEVDPTVHTCSLIVRDGVEYGQNLLDALAMVPVGRLVVVGEKPDVAEQARSLGWQVDVYHAGSVVPSVTVGLAGLLAYHGFLFDAKNLLRPNVPGQVGIERIGASPDGLAEHPPKRLEEFPFSSECRNYFWDTAAHPAVDSEETRMLSSVECLVLVIGNITPCVVRLFNNGVSLMLFPLGAMVPQGFTGGTRAMKLAWPAHASHA